MREMKDSGVAWIGEIPKDWSIEKVRQIFQQRSSKGNKTAILLSATQSNGMRPQSELEGVVQVKTDTDLQQFKTVHKNDFVISLRSFQGGFEMSDFEGVCSPAYQVFFNTKSIHHGYYKLLFKSQGLISQINALTVGIREGKNIKYETFSYMSIPIPKLTDQQAIATYLDSKCTEIDELITLQETMISELQAYKQSVITEAVTKGLDKNVKLKDSGVEWIGEIPEHWELMKLKRACAKEQYNIKTGPFGSQLKGSDLRDEGLVKVYNQRNVIDSNFDDVKFFVTDEKARDLKSFYTRPNDILITSRGTICKAAILPNDKDMGILHPCLIALRVDTKIIDRLYLLYLINGFSGFRTNISLESNATTIEVIYTDTLKNIYIAVPPFNEQQTLILYLDQKTTEIDSLIAIKQQKIAELKEYKKSTIFEYVTGKKEVPAEYYKN